MRALILVDLQYDFCPGGALPVARGDETIAIANKVMPHFANASTTHCAAYLSPTVLWRP